MSVQLLLNNIPQGIEFDSPSLQATVFYSGGLFFLNSEQVELTDDQISDLHFDCTQLDMQHLNEFQPGLFYQL